MTTLTATEASRRLDELLSDVAQSHDVIQIAGRQHSAVLVSEDDWRAIRETLHLASVPGMKESIVDGLRTPSEYSPFYGPIPIKRPPPYEKLVGELAGAYSRRINIQHRIVYQIVDGRGKGTGSCFRPTIFLPNTVFRQKMDQSPVAP